ncbi:hypothetical protein ACA910_016377 [Epithemia clementina (nom. ined.)]
MPLYRNTNIASSIATNPAMSKQDMADAMMFHSSSRNFEERDNQITSHDQVNKTNLLIRAIQQQLTALTEASREQTKILNAQRKANQIRFALENVGRFTPFIYWAAINNLAEKTVVYESSADLVARILWTFLQGMGCPIPNGYIIPMHDPNGCDYEHFQNLLVTQLHQLIRSKPRLQQEEDGSLTIWYE